MDSLYTTLANWLGGYLEYTIYGFVFVSTALVIIGLTYWLMTGTNPVERRLKEIAAGRTANEEHVMHQEGAFNVRWVEPVLKLVEPTEGWEKSTLRTRLVRAGYRDKRAINVLYAAKVITAILLPLIIVVPSMFGTLATAKYSTLVLSFAATGLIGFFLPDFVLDRKAARRRREFEEGFPDAMDMLVVCVEAGLGLDAAIQRVGKEIVSSHPELGIEFSIVSLELRAGKGRADALRALAERTGLDDVRALTSILIQAEHFGTSIAEALREHSNEMRTLRLQRAKERAAKLPVKLIFPIIFFIFPALFLVVLGPALVRIFAFFAGGMQ
jgi:tight adherence protein C